MLEAAQAFPVSLQPPSKRQNVAFQPTRVSVFIPFLFDGLSDQVRANAIDGFRARERQTSAAHVSTRRHLSDALTRCHAVLTKSQCSSSTTANGPATANQSQPCTDQSGMPRESDATALIPKWNPVTHDTAEMRRVVDLLLLNIPANEGTRP